MAEALQESLESTTVGVYRTAATVKGGRRFSFSALVVVGDRNGRVGIGYGKANQVPPAIEKAQKAAKRAMRPYPLLGGTIPHEVEGRFGACRVRLIPASPGTGVIAGAAVRAPLEMVGVQDCLTKSLGSNNGKNLVKAVINGLDQLRDKHTVGGLRGVEIGTTNIEEAVERGREFMPAVRTRPNAEQVQEGGGRGGRGGRKAGGGRGRGGRGRGRTDKVTQQTREASTRLTDPPATTEPGADNVSKSGEAMETPPGKTGPGGAQKGDSPSAKPEDGK